MARTSSAIRRELCRIIGGCDEDIFIVFLDTLLFSISSLHTQKTYPLSPSPSISFDQPLAASVVGLRVDFDFNDAARSAACK